ncbi:glycosyltransferase, partial [Priestia megaterium]|uniref:glycosyltransferase n=1 Tax=Priestia megaterium TaxID=1404 RepID=UPI00300B958E
FLAVLIKRKGILDLIEASQKIITELESKNKQVEFVIAGDGELESTSKSLVEKLGVSKYFKFVGWVNNEQKQELLKESDLFVLPSYNEGLPLSILEAISYGIPVISTNVGSINEAVKNEENGYLINPGDKEKLADFTIKLLTDSNFKQMGQASRKVAVDLFDINSYFKMVENLYLTVDQRKTLGNSHGAK